MNTADMLDLVKTQASKDWVNVYQTRAIAPTLHEGKYWYQYSVTLISGRIISYLVGTEASNMGVIRGFAGMDEFKLND